MARARSPNSIEAEKLYHDKMPLVEIARKFDVPASTVRRWKCTQKWEDNNPKKSGKKKSERSDKKKANVRKPRGAPKGNKNAVGHAPSTPAGNKNAVKHGGYSEVYWDTLDEEERKLIGGIPDDEEDLLLEQIRLFSVRERRLMIAINKYRSAKGDVYVSGVSRFEKKRSFKDKEEEELYHEIITEKVKNNDRLPGESYTLTTDTASAADLITRLEKELTSVQSKKTKAIDSLARLREEKRKAGEADKGNDLVRTWAEQVLKARREKNGE